MAASAPIRVLLVDDQALLRQGLRLILEHETDLEVVGEVGDGRAAVEACARLQPQVVLMDLQMPVLDGVDATRELVASGTAAQILILTTFDDDEYVLEALRAGACGYLLKDVGAERLLEAIRAAARGEAFLPPAIARKVVAELRAVGPETRTRAANERLPEALSARELEVLQELAQGHSNRAIAAAVHLSEGTVKNHITKILAKLDAEDRQHAVARARELGLLPGNSGGHGRT